MLINAVGSCDRQARGCNRTLHRNLGLSRESLSLDLTLEILVPGGWSVTRKLLHYSTALATALTKVRNRASISAAEVTG